MKTRLILPDAERFSLMMLMLMWLVSSSGLSQEPYFRQVGLSGSFGDEQINCLFQDHDGYVWIGTTGGVYQFNGLTLKSPVGSEKFITSGVTAIFEDSQNNLWFGLDDGNVLHFSGHGQPGEVKADSLPDRRITSIIEGNNHRIWIGTYGDGIYYIDDLRMVKMGNGPHLADNYIYSFAKDVKGRIWAGTDNGINLLHVNENNFEIKHITVEDGLPDFIIRHIENDLQGNMWIGMHEYGVCRYDLAEDRIEVPDMFTNWEFGSVNSILAMDDRLWIATNGYGLIEYIHATDRMTSHEEINGINLSRIKTMMRDREGNVWVASGNNIHLSFGNRLGFVHQVETYTTDNIHALIAGSNDFIWFANDEGVFSYYAGNKNRINKYNIGLNLQRQKVMSLYEDMFGYIWIGTFGQGIIRLQPKTGQYKMIGENDGLVNGNVLSIKGNEDEIWFATLGGASRVEVYDDLGNLDFIPEFKNFGKKEGLSNNFIYDLHIDEENRVWFATDGSGVVTYEDDVFWNLGADSVFGNKVVYSVTSGKNMNVWINAAGEGIYKFDGQSPEPFFNDPEHDKLTFSGICANQNNELVLAYDDGIDVLQTITGEVIHYEENAGLPDINPDLNTLSMDRNGNVWIGTSNFLVKYKPRTDTTWTKPRTHIDKVSVFLEPIHTTTDTVFSHAQNHFSFDYSGLWYQYPDKVTYNIKLEGHDLDWMTTRNNNMIYSNLSPGNYVFRVKSGLYANFDNALEASFSFTIKKPYWQTVWFYMLILIVLGVIIFTIIRIRERAISRREEVIREKIKFQFENLKSQINPHFLFNSFSTLIALIELDPDEAIKYVDELSVLFRNVLEYKDMDVITLGEELKIIDNYIRLQKKRYGDNLIISIKNPPDPGKIKIPPLTLQLLIENALKHNVVSKDRPLTIRIFANMEKGFIFVSNNLQLKKEVLSSTGVGIENIINRYRILTDKEINIEKTEDQFTVGIPIIIE